MRGRGKADACFACHEQSGISRTPEVPSIAGQPQQFLFLQLFLFRERLRNVATMTPFVAGRSNEDLEDLAAYFSALLPAATAGDRDRERYARGERLAKRHNCGSCHGRDYAGSAHMPRLAGQREDYLRHALRQYQANERVGFDTSMAGVLHGLTAEDLSDLAHFAAQFR